ncbi:TPA: acyltransferase [Serratia marcescens]|nr:acyltransferase [Serratia marcescens]
MPLYENYYMRQCDPLWGKVTNVNSSFSGDPDITLTWVKDSTFPRKTLEPEDFDNCIAIGNGCYIESLNRLAFQNGIVKLTSVKVNESRPGVIIIGNNVVIQGVSIVAYENVTIEDNVTLGPNVTIMDSSGHPLCHRGTENEASLIKKSPVLIKENVWIGMNSIILKGVTIGRNSIIGAGSVIRENIPDDSVAYGNPAIITPLKKEI